MGYCLAAANVNKMDSAALNMAGLVRLQNWEMARRITIATITL